MKDKLIRRGIVGAGITASFGVGMTFGRRRETSISPIKPETAVFPQNPPPTPVADISVPVATQVTEELGRGGPSSTEVTPPSSLADIARSLMAQSNATGERKQIEQLCTTLEQLEYATGYTMNTPSRTYLFERIWSERKKKNGDLHPTLKKYCDDNKIPYITLAYAYDASEILKQTGDALREVPLVVMASIAAHESEGGVNIGDTPLDILWGNQVQKKQKIEDFLKGIQDVEGQDIQRPIDAFNGKNTGNFGIAQMLPDNLVALTDKPVNKNGKKTNLNPWNITQGLLSIGDILISLAWTNGSTFYRSASFNLYKSPADGWYSPENLEKQLQDSIELQKIIAANNNSIWV